MSTSPQAVPQSVDTSPTEHLGGNPFSWRFTAPLFVGSALNPINSSLIATALAPIAHGIGVPVGQTTALVTVLYLATAITQPTAGKAADVFGPRRVFLAGIVLVGVGGVVGGVAQNLITLLISRLLIGIGTSCAYPTAMLLIRRRATEHDLERPPGGVLGGLQIAGIATASLGLPIGGVLVGWFGWRSVFLVNIPVAAIALIATLTWVSADPPMQHRRGARDIASRLDAIGILGFAAAMTALLLFLFDLPTTRWWVLGISLMLWVSEIVWELRAATPFLDIRLLGRNRALTTTYLRFGIVMLCVSVVLYGLTQWTETARGLSETAAGLLLLPMTLIGGVIIVPISRRNLVRGPLIASALACLLASAGVLLLDSSVAIGVVIAVTIVFGVAMGAATTGNQTALYSQAPADQFGTASGLMRTFGYVGSIAASAITGIVFHAHVTDHGMHQLSLIMIGLSVVLVVVTLADRTLISRSSG